MQYINLDETVYFFFGANDTEGNGANGTGEAFTVRLAGAPAGDPPMVVTGGTVVRLTNVGFTDGSYEIAIPALNTSGFTKDATYAVFATLLVDAKNPTGHVGIFRIQGVPSSVVDMVNDVITNAAIQNAAISSTKFAAGAIDAAAIATDAIDADALATSAVNEIVDGTWDELLSGHVIAGSAGLQLAADVDLAATGLDNISIDGIVMPLALEIIAAGVAGELSGAGSGTETFKGLDADATPPGTTRIVSTVDASGNRTNVTYP